MKDLIYPQRRQKVKFSDGLCPLQGYPGEPGAAGEPGPKVCEKTKNKRGVGNGSCRNLNLM